MLEWFKNKDEKNVLEKVVDEATAKIENDAELKLGHYKATQIPDDQEKNIEGQADFFKIDLEPYSYYAKEVESKLEPKHYEIVELKSKIDNLEKDMELEKDYRKKDLIYQGLKPIIEKYNKMVKAFGDEYRNSENN